MFAGEPPAADCCTLKAPGKAPSTVSDPNAVRTLSSPEDFDALLEVSDARPVWILKHSTRCPVSSVAHGEFERHAASAAALTLSALSREIAERLGVVHQSPQAILVRGRRVVWSATHGSVTVEALEAAEEDGA